MEDVCGVFLLGLLFIYLASPLIEGLYKWLNKNLNDDWRC